jgi:hypothetical protein
LKNESATLHSQGNGWPSARPQHVKGWPIIRFVILVLILFTIGCEEDESCSMSGNSECGETNEAANIAIITAGNPYAEVMTGDACRKGEAQYMVLYRYVDQSKQEGFYEHPLSEKPPISMKLSTKEYGNVNVGSSIFSSSKPGDAARGETTGTVYNGYWKVTSEGAMIDKKYQDIKSPIHWKLSVTLQRPLVTLPSKNAPTIKLPLLGTIIGPKPRDVEVKMYVDYPDPLKTNK